MMRAIVLAGLLTVSAAGLAEAQTPPAPALDLRPLPASNGPFSAMAAFVLAGNLDAFEKPSGTEPTLVVAKTAKVGDSAALKIVFLGAQRDANGRIDVTYDLRFEAPNGGVYGGMDNKGLKALLAAVPAGVGYLDNKQDLAGIHFEPQDAPGAYTAKVVLHDNVGKRDIPLTARIELTK